MYKGALSRTIIDYKEAIYATRPQLQVVMQTVVSLECRHGLAKHLFVEGSVVEIAVVLG